MVDNQCPIVNANRHIRQGDITFSDIWQRFEASAQIVAKQAQRPSLEGKNGIIIGPYCQ
ncbi:hypothetical protein D3C81_2193800 [compost metagenome]